jgi:hypothetical protein
MGSCLFRWFMRGLEVVFSKHISARFASIQHMNPVGSGSSPSRNQVNIIQICSLRTQKPI